MFRNKVEVYILNYNNYEINLILDPKNQFMKSKVKLTYYSKKDNTNEIIFYIHKNMDIKQVTCNIMDTLDISEDVVEWSPFIKESKRIKITCNRYLLKEEKLEIYFEYSCHVSIVTEYGINRITEDWVELGLYTPWFPLLEDLELSLFNTDITIDSEYIVVNGYNVQNTNNKWSITQDKPEFDSTIIASNKFNYISKKSNDININVYYIENSYEKVANKISEISAWVLENYKNKFGEIHESDYSIVLAPNRVGGIDTTPKLINK